MSNTPEQYTVKTLEEIKEQVAKKNGFDDWADLQLTWLERVGRKLVVHENYIDQVAKLWNAELIKENERLRGTIGVEAVRQNLEFKQMLPEIVNAQTNANTIEDIHEAYGFLQSSLNDILSKFQPKKDESISKG